MGVVLHVESDVEVEHAQILSPKAKMEKNVIYEIFSMEKNNLITLVKPFCGTGWPYSLQGPTSSSHRAVGGQPASASFPLPAHISQRIT